MRQPEKEHPSSPSVLKPDRYQYAPKIVELRGGRTQAELARILGVTQVSISKWESGVKSPTHANLVKLAEIAQTPGLRTWFREAARHKSGLSSEDVQNVFLTHPSDDHVQFTSAVPPGMRRIPPYVDKDNPDPPTGTGKDAVEAELVLPMSLFGHGGTLRAVRVRGDCMLPVIDRGWIVVVDLEVGEFADLVGSLVAVRSEQGMRIRFLQRLGKEFVLVPQNAISRNPVQLVQPEGPWSILGRVISWIGAPFEAQQVPLNDPFEGGRKFRKAPKTK